MTLTIKLCNTACACSFGTWSNEPPANSYGQIVLARLFANFTVNWVKLHGPNSAESGARALTFNSVSDTAFMSGYTRASIDGQVHSGQSDALMSAYSSNGSRLWTQIFGTSIDDSGSDIFSYQLSAIHAGQLNINDAFIEYRLLNGSVGWQKLQYSASCGLFYSVLDHVENDVFAYAMGAGGCVVSGGFQAPTYDTFVVRHFVVNGSRDATWSVTIRNDLENDFIGVGAVDLVTQRLAIAGHNGVPLPEYATVSLNGSLIYLGVDRLISFGLVQCMTVTKNGIIVFSGELSGQKAFVVIDNATFARSTPMVFSSTLSQSTSTTSNSASSTMINSKTLTYSAINGTMSSTKITTNVDSHISSAISQTVAGLSQVTEPLGQLSVVNLAEKSKLAATSTVSTTMSVIRGNDVTGTGQVLPIVVISVVASAILLLILCSVIGIWRYLTLKKRKHNKARAVSGDDTTTVMQDTQTSMGNTDMTAIVTSHELSIPAFLMVDHGTDYRQEQQIASGSQGIVCLVYVYTGSQLAKRSKGAAVVGKFANVQVKTMNPEVRVAFYQEISLHWMFRDTPGFARVYGYAEQPVATILMEFYPLGSLQAFIEAKKSSQAVAQFIYTKRQVLSLLHDCAFAFSSMHTQGVVHCDIKSANVLLKVSEQGKLQAIVTDFGIARLLSSGRIIVSEFKESRLNGLSLSYAAPVALTRLRNANARKDVSPQVWMAADIYSNAMMLKEMLTRKAPWSL